MHLRTVLTECAWGATRKKNSYLKNRYYSILDRRGEKKALFAIAHKILIASYFVLKNKKPYKEPVLFDATKLKEMQINRYIRKLKELGVTV